MKMSREDKYYVNSVVAKLKRGEASNFLDPRELNLIIPELNKTRIEYQIYYPYEGAEKVILYSYNEPKIVLFEIRCSTKLEHRDIMGSLFGLQIEKDTFGDIIITDKNYIMVVDHMKDYIKYNLNQIGNKNVELIEKDILAIKDYKKAFADLTITSSSTRIDAVIAKIIGGSRSNALDLIRTKNVILNYNTLSKHTYLLKEGDIFSVRGYGKYRYSGISHYTKNNKLIINYQKYI